MTRHKIITLAIATLLATTLQAQIAGPLSVPEIPSPKLDGTLDDPAWKNAAKIERLYFLDTDKPNESTTIYMGRDKAWLYFGFRRHNPNMTQVEQTVSDHDGSVFKDESVEIFLKPESAKKRYYHFGLSFANVAYEKRVLENGVRDEGWKAPWRSVTKRSTDGWTAEVAIPLFALESDDLGGMSVNLLRTPRKWNSTPMARNKRKRRRTPR